MLSPNNRRVYAVGVAGLILAFFLAWAGASPFPPLNPPQHFRNYPSSNSAHNQNEPIGFWKSVETDPIAAFTLLLVAVTAWLAFATNRAANAAKTAAEALPRLEQAYVFFSEAKGDIQDTVVIEAITRTDNPGIIKATYRFKNHGRTPAIVTHLDVVLDYIEVGFPDKPSGGELPSHLIVSSQETSPNIDRAASEYRGRITRSEYQKATVGTGRIFFCGRIVYLDVFGKSHETGICAEWNFDGNRFIISKNKDLNYYT
jgi:hypothetical protein